MIFVACAHLLRIVEEEVAEAACLVWLQPIARVDGQLEDLVRRLLGDFLDVDAAGGTDHEHRLLRLTVENDADVRFARDVRGGRDEHFQHRKSFDVQGENLRGDLFRLGGILRELHSAGFAAAAGMHLRLDDDRTAVLGGQLLDFFGRRRHFTGRNGNAFLPE